MAERYSASQEPFPTSTFSDDNRQPRVAGRYEGFDNPTPVAGRVTGRYDGFDSGVSPTGRGVGNPPAPTGGSYGQPAGSLSGTPTGGRVAGSYDQPTGLLYGNPTPGRVAGTYHQPAGPLSGTPTGSRVGGSYDQPAAPLSGTPTGGRVGGNYDQPAGLFYGTPTGGRAGSSYGQPAGPISGTPAPGRVGGSYNQPAGSLSSTPAPGRVAGSYDQPAGSLSGTPTPGRVEIPSDVNPRVVTPTGNRGDGKSSGPAPRYDPAPPALQGGADRSAPAPAMDLNRSDPPPSTVRRRRAAPGEQRTTMTNDGATNDSARRKEDDTETGQGQMMGVTGLLRNPRNRLYLATLVAATPFLISFAFYVSQFSFFGQFIIGVLCGLCIQAVYMLYSLHRKHQRKSRTVKIAQMATLDADQLKILLPTAESFPKWISFTAFERMDWLNKTMTKLWPYIDQAASDLIKQKVQPILDQYAMGVIQKLELKEVAFGNKAPQVTGVRLTEGLEDETVLEIKILWNTSKEGVVLSVDFPGPNYKVQLKNWHLEGTAKLIFKPLTGTIPGFGAVLVSLTEPPDFDFDLKFLGGDIGALPGVEKMIDNSIRTALMDSLVWPSRIVIPMIPGGDFSFLELHPVGELDVMVVEAKNIKNTDLLGKADPFVTLFVRQTKDKIKRSTTKKNTLKPVWNENFKLEVEDPESQRLTLRLMDDESVEKSEYIGTVVLAIKEFKPHVRTELWCDVLEDPESHAPDQIRGSVHIVVTFNPYSRDEVVAKRGYNETEKKIYEEQQIILEQKKTEHKTAGEAPKQQGNITQHPAEKPRAPGPTAEL